MAKCNKPINSAYLAGGIAALFIVGFSLSNLLALYSGASITDITNTLNLPYLGHIIVFTFKQAILSALLAIIPAIFIAQAIFRRAFWGKSLLLRFYTMIFVLPTLVTMLGLTAVYGRVGWLNQLINAFGGHFTISLYGLQGILLAHLFYNLPLALRFILQALDNIPSEQHQLSAQLNFSYWQHFRIVEWPAIRRQLIPCSVLIFMLCFTSFSLVLTLGGGPKNSTIEVAIFQAIRNFDLNQAALLAIVQIICCVILTILTQKMVQHLPLTLTTGQKWRNPIQSKWVKGCDIVFITLSILLLLPPLVAVFIQAIHSVNLATLAHKSLWIALLTSLRIALCSSLLCLLLTIMLLWSSRQLFINHSPRWARQIELSGLIILAMPSMVLATGLFILLNQLNITQGIVGYLLIISNALIAIPFVLKILAAPMYDSALRYQQLCASLNLTGLRRFYWVDLLGLRRSFGLAFAFAALLSIGDFGVIALLGNESLVTLPYYLYEQAGYHQNYAMVAAGILLLLCLILFSFIELIANKHDNT